jgi:hypothetical protein
MPRPDVAALGTSYRRIPLISIGRDIYNDTRLIISKLEEFYPTSNQHPSISASSTNDKALEKLLEVWAIDAGLFNRAVQLIPSDMPLLKDEKYQKDRENFSGRRWSKEKIDAARPEALVEMRAQYEMLEDVIFADGRDWVLGTESPTLADIEGMCEL